MFNFRTPHISKFSSRAKPAFWLACLTVIILSLTPIEQFPPQLIDWWDKAQHAIAFFVLSCLGFIAYYSKPKQIIVVALLLLGIAIEIAQNWLGWRYGDIADVLANLSGIAIATGFFMVMEWLSRRNRDIF